jgi:hypothetical protein
MEYLIYFILLILSICLTGCGDTSNTTRTIFAITTQPIDQTVSEGQTATFSVAATVSSSAANLTYQWYKGNLNSSIAISGATGSSYTTPATTTADSGTQYYVIVTQTDITAPNSVSTMTSNIATLTVCPTIPVTPTFGIATPPNAQYNQQTSITIPGSNVDTVTNIYFTDPQTFAQIEGTITNKFPTLLTVTTPIVSLAGSSTIYYQSCNTPTSTSTGITFTFT